MDDGGEAPQTHFVFWIRKAARDKFQLNDHVKLPPFRSAVELSVRVFLASGQNRTACPTVSAPLSSFSASINYNVYFKLSRT